MRMRYRLIAAILAAMLVTVALWAFLWREHQGLYRVTILPSLGGHETAATGINDRGQVAGFAETADGVFHFFLWDRANGMQDLGPAIKTTFYINDVGQIAGTTRDAGGNVLAFLWDPANGLRTLGTLGGKESVTTGLNNGGQVVGKAQTAAGPLHAFVWDETAGMRDLGTFGGAKSEALSINDAGQVFGRADSATREYQAFYWDCEKGMTAVEPPAPSDARWFGMNNRGYALGEDHGQMFLWRDDVGIRRLFPGGASYILPILNDVNQVVSGESSHGIIPSWAESILRPNLRCYLWDPVHGRISLDDCARRKLAEVLYAWDLNNKGCIVGALVNEGRMRARAILLEPIPQRWRKQ
jgi:probable HAF family extracellular repeat protein